MHVPDEPSNCVFQHTLAFILPTVEDEETYIEESALEQALVAGAAATRRVEGPLLATIIASDRYEGRVYGVAVRIWELYRCIDAVEGVVEAADEKGIFGLLDLRAVRWLEQKLTLQAAS